MGQASRPSPVLLIIYILYSLCIQLRLPEYHGFLSMIALIQCIVWTSSAAHACVIPEGYLSRPLARACNIRNNNNIQILFLTSYCNPVVSDGIARAWIIPVQSFGYFKTHCRVQPSTSSLSQVWTAPSLGFKSAPDSITLLGLTITSPPVESYLYGIRPHGHQPGFHHS